MNPHILVLEDDEGLATLVAKKLEREGATVEVFSAADPALQRMQMEPRIELVVVDYRLSALTNGIDFVHSATKAGWTGRAVLVTGFLDEHVVLQALRAGIDDVFPKTLDFVDHLVSAVQRLISQSLQEHELDVLKQEKKILVRLNESYAAANVIAWSWNKIHPAQVEMTGAQLVGLTEDQTGIIDVHRLKERASKAHWRSLVSRLGRARRSGEPFELDWEISDGSTKRSLLLRGRWRASGVLSGVAIDVTDRVEMESQVHQALTESKRLNERLRFSISETHHRVKNSLQLVSSLLGMEFRRLDPGLKDVSRRMLTQIRALALLHDRLTEVQRDGRDKSIIALPDFVRDIAHLVGAAHITALHTSLPIPATPRQASTLGVIVTECLTRLPQNSNVTIEWKVTGAELRLLLSIRIAETQDELLVDSKAIAQSFIDNPVVKNLLKAEFRSEPIVSSKSKSELLIELPMAGLDVGEDVLGAFQ